MESLLLYGLAILVVLLAIGALTYFGVLDLGRALPDRCTLTSSGALDCLEWSVSQGTPADGAAAAVPGTVTLGLKNIAASGIKITDGTLTIEGSAITCSTTSDLDLVSGQTGQYVLTCTGALPQRVGQKVRGELELTYDGQIVTGTKATGSIVAAVTST